MTNQMETLHNSVTKIKRLLDNCDDGSLSWNEQLRVALIENQKALCDLGISPESYGIKYR